MSKYNKCPECGGEQYCPCESCKPRHGEDKVWIWVTPDGPISCGHCGHTMSVEKWESYEWDSFNRDRAKEQP